MKTSLRRTDFPDCTENRLVNTQDQRYISYNMSQEYITINIKLVSGDILPVQIPSVDLKVNEFCRLVFEALPVDIRPYDEYQLCLFPAVDDDEMKSVNELTAYDNSEFVVVEGYRMYHLLIQSPDYSVILDYLGDVYEWGNNNRYIKLNLDIRRNDMDTIYTRVCYIQPHLDGDIYTQEMVTIRPQTQWREDEYLVIPEDISPIDIAGLFDSFEEETYQVEDFIRDFKGGWKNLWEGFM